MDDPSAEFTMELSPLDQIMPRVYTRVVLCFELLPGISRPEVVLRLREGLAATVTRLPFLAGNVQLVSGSGASSGKLEIRYRKHDQVILQVEDLDRSMPTFDELQAARMPMSLLDGNLLAPVPAFPDAANPTPVFAVQANFVEGGLLLCICVHHAVMDGTGVGILTNALACGCRLETIPEELEDKFQDRLSLSSIKPDPQPARAHPEYGFLKSTAELNSSGASPLPRMSSRMFHLDSDRLAKLKAAASPVDGSSWISTNDALSALIWTCVTRARSSHLSSSASSMLGMAVNGRSRLVPPLPKTYMGNVNLYAHTVARVCDLQSSSSLSSIAVAVRNAVISIDDEHIRSVVALSCSAPDVRSITPGFRSFLGGDVAITSWAAMPVYEANFGPEIGRPRWVRIPKAEFDGLVIILPRQATSERGLEVLVGLRVDDMEKLLVDEVWNKYADEGVE